MEISAKDIRTEYLQEERVLKIFVKRSFFLIRVVQTQKDMVRYVNTEYPTSKVNADVAGCFYPTYKWVNRNESLQLTTCLGEIYLSQDLMTDTIIQHECIHAAFAYVRRIICRRRGMKEYVKGVQVDRAKEELLCHLSTIFAGLIADTFLS